MQFRYDDDKNIKLGLERKIDFEQIIGAALEGNILDIELHHNQVRYPNQ